MSFKRIMHVLQELGFSKEMAEIYIYLAKEGPKTRKELAQVLMMTKLQIRQALKSLESKKAIIINSDSLPSVVVFEEFLSNYIKEELMLADEIEKNKEDLMEHWEEVLENSNFDK